MSPAPGGNGLPVAPTTTDALGLTSASWRRSGAAAGAVMCVAAAACGGAPAAQAQPVRDASASPTVTTTIRGCVFRDRRHSRRMFLPSGACPRGARTLRWNVQGLAGRPGRDGAAGADGPAGPAGPVGAVGAAGATGTQGLRGAPGTTGSAGAAGVSGLDGAPGPDGLPGADGGTGPVGPTGAEGPEGVQGVQGDGGSAGPAGPQGDPGTAGVSGYTRVVGTPSATDSVSPKVVTATCPAGKVVVGGGAVGSAATGLAITRSYPASTTVWEAALTAGAGPTWWAQAYALCATAN